jgi:hypothetical protein
MDGCLYSCVEFNRVETWIMTAALSACYLYTCKTVKKPAFHFLRKKKFSMILNYTHILFRDIANTILIWGPCVFVIHFN